jgi:hypothetical protein
MPSLQHKSRKAAARLRAGTPVLITESADEFVAMRKRLYDEITPKGIIEEGWVNDLAAVEWDIMRLPPHQSGNFERRVLPGAHQTPQAGVE